MNFYLVQRKICYALSQFCHFQAQPTRQGQSRELIDTLKRKGEQLKPFERLTEALSSDIVGQQWLADEIRAIFVSKTLTIWDSVRSSFR